MPNLSPQVVVVLVRSMDRRALAAATINDGSAVVVSHGIDSDGLSNKWESAGTVPCKRTVFRNLCPDPIPSLLRRITAKFAPCVPCRVLHKHACTPTHTHTHTHTSLVFSVPNVISACAPQSVCVKWCETKEVDASTGLQ
jgi:hypothetical protein